ncbi:hypothetical protein GPALN_005235 [Globodera pallida]|nr:hypothetical protein GPALN_005235 [Globodera pallida]
MEICDEYQVGHCDPTEKDECVPIIRQEQILQTSGAEDIQMDKVFFFRTFPRHSAKKTFTIAIFGDLGLKRPEEQGVFEDQEGSTWKHAGEILSAPDTLAPHAMESLMSLVHPGYHENHPILKSHLNERSSGLRMTNVQLILHIGDIAYDMHEYRMKKKMRVEDEDEDYNLGDRFMQVIEDIAAYVPYMVVAGNHENEEKTAEYHQGKRTKGTSEKFEPQFEHYESRFKMPRTFEGHNTSQYYELGTNKANQNRHKHPWVIVLQHRPFYCTSISKVTCRFNKTHKHGLPSKNDPNKLVYGLEELFNKYYVDLVITGHEHTFELFPPIELGDGKPKVIPEKFWWEVHRNARHIDEENEELVDTRHVFRTFTDPVAPIYLIVGRPGNAEEMEKLYPVPWLQRITYSNRFSYTLLQFPFDVTHTKSTLAIRQVDINNGDVPAEFFVEKTFANYEPEVLCAELDLIDRGGESKYRMKLSDLTLERVQLLLNPFTKRRHKKRQSRNNATPPQGRGRAKTAYSVENELTSKYDSKSSSSSSLSTSSRGEGEEQSQRATRRRKSESETGRGLRPKRTADTGHGDGTQTQKLAHFVLMAKLMFALFFATAILSFVSSEERAFWLQNYSQLLPNFLSSDPIRQNPWQSDKYFYTQQKEATNASDEKERNNWKDWILPWRHYKENSTIKNGNWTSQNGKRRKFVRVRIGGGPIKGAVSYYAGPDKPVFMFKGIPMAEPPVGTLRFRPLQKKRPWGKVLDATKYSPACPSNTTRTHSPQHYISEDCIYMNVFTDPKCMREKPCPVLFYVHGGGFVYDSATMFNDSQIVRKYASDGVVFLIPAYRLGIFGFLDLGDDRTVKRNLGMHDIIFALEWAQKEVHAFGGDPERVTVMGNSAGGSAVAYLCTSPALTESHFQQAIISSASPYFTNDTNRSPSKALVEHFNCSNSNNRTADDGRRSFWPATDWETAECLRHVDSLELLRQQQVNEEQSHLFFVGPETDSNLLPARSYAALLKYWKVRPLLMMTTAKEMHRLEGDTLHDQCIQAIVTFGFLDTVAYGACIDRYNATFMQEKNMRISYESMHAEAFLTALVNTRKGGQSFVGEFEIANYSNHANDMYFFVGLHEVPMDRLDVKLMDWYYPQMIKNFFDNGTLSDWPHGVDGYQDVAGLDFWLRELAEVERNGTRKAGDDGQTWQSVFVPKEPEGEEEGAEDGKREEYPLKRTFIRPTKSIPAHGAFLARPLPEMLNMPIAENDDGTLTADKEDNGTLTADKEDNGTLTADKEDNGTLTAGEEDNGTLIESEKDKGTNRAETTNKNEALALASGELHKVWTAFWLTTTVTVLLAISLLLFSATKMIHRHRNRCCAYSSNNSAGDSELYTEKSRIFVANDANAMRYA